MSNAQAITSWFVLITLTFVSVYMGNIVGSSLLFTILVFVVVFLKGQQITDVFMELKHAPTKWRILLLSYVSVLPGIICIIYLI